MTAQSYQRNGAGRVKTSRHISVIRSHRRSRARVRPTRSRKTTDRACRGPDAVRSAGRPRGRLGDDHGNGTGSIFLRATPAAKRRLPHRFRSWTVSARDNEQRPSAPRSRSGPPVGPSARPGHRGGAHRRCRCGYRSPVVSLRLGHQRDPARLPPQRRRRPPRHPRRPPAQSRPRRVGRRLRSGRPADHVADGGGVCRGHFTPACSAAAARNASISADPGYVPNSSYFQR